MLAATQSYKQIESIHSDMAKTPRAYKSMGLYVLECPKTWLKDEKRTITSAKEFFLDDLKLLLYLIPPSLH